MNEEQPNYNQDEKRFKSVVFKIGIGFLILGAFLILNPIVVIGVGKRGVVFNNATGIEDRVLGEGVHFRIPFVQDVKTLSVKVQKDEVTAQAASKDLQTVTAKVAVNWHLDASQVHRVFQNIGRENDVVDRIIIPNVNEVVKAATAQSTAEELLTKRVNLKESIDVGLTERLRAYNVVVDDISIVDIDFSEQFNRAIENKATAEQEALAEKNKLESVKFQAQQAIEKSKAEAEAIRIKASALAQNQELVKLNAVDKWDGKLPQYWLGSGTLPFINITQ